MSLHEEPLTESGQDWSLLCSLQQLSWIFFAIQAELSSLWLRVYTFSTTVNFLLSGWTPFSKEMNPTQDWGFFPKLACVGWEAYFFLGICVTQKVNLQDLNSSLGFCFLAWKIKGSKFLLLRIVGKVNWGGERRVESLSGAWHTTTR